MIDEAVPLPEVGLFTYVVCPNYLGEIVAWTGYTLVAQHVGAVAFLTFTCANLVPRAHHHYKWYQTYFGGARHALPHGQKRLVPFVY